MNKKALYRSAYRLLDDITPLKFDCGLLCGSKCCLGDSEKGMLLFPGEEVMLERAEDFLDVRKENLNDMGVNIAVCKGTCPRSFRPLSCRIFPLIPYIVDDGSLTVIEDPRARYICPLLMNLEQAKIQKLFYSKVLKAFRILMQDADIKACVEALSRTVEDYLKFTGKSKK